MIVWFHDVSGIQAFGDLVARFSERKHPVRTRVSSSAETVGEELEQMQAVGDGACHATSAVTTTNVRRRSQLL